MAEDSLWIDSPSAGMVIQLGPAETRVLRANRACADLLGLPLGELEQQDSLQQFCTEKAFTRLRKFIEGDSRKHLILDLKSADGRQLDVRFLRHELEEPEAAVLLSLQDLTEIQEDARALQAGYDEFIRITRELEDALEVIERQNRLLEQQSNTMKQELVIAHRVQEHMFRLNFDQFRRVNAAGYYEAMTELGGDMWEFLETPTEFLGVLGDVMGHGVAASLISIAAKNHFKRYFEQFGQTEYNLGLMLSAVNQDLLIVTDRRYFITVGMVRIGPSLEMEYLTAGHPPLLVVPADPSKPMRQLFTEQPMLGIFESVDYGSQTEQLEPGDRVLMYTDCLTETSNAEGEVLPIEEIGELIREHSKETPDATVNEILRYRSQFGGSQELPDDLTLICIEIPFDVQETAGEPVGAERIRLAET